MGAIEENREHVREWINNNAASRTAFRNEILEYNRQAIIDGRLCCPVPEDPYRVAEKMTVRIIS